MPRKWIWEGPEWPVFTWDSAAVMQPLAAARRKQGELLGAMRILGLQNKRAALLDAMTDEALATARIEGEQLDRDAVFSSVAIHLGMPEASRGREDARAEGLVEMTVDATRNFALPLTRERLFHWHTHLFPLNDQQIRPILLGNWRTQPMQILEGPFGSQRVRYEAPPPDRLPGEMTRFLSWFAASPSEEGLIRCAIAHFWFEAIHPFDDGNGRIGRAIADMQLARDEQLGDRFYSVSKQLLADRRAYYDALREASLGGTDLTPWIVWFLECIARAITSAGAVVDDVVRAGEFWQRVSHIEMSDRQRNVLNKFLHGFEGKLTAKKWAALAKTSPATASRDIADLVDRGILVKDQGGSKNTSYLIDDGPVRPA